MEINRKNLIKIFHYEDSKSKSLLDKDFFPIKLVGNGPKYRLEIRPDLLPQNHFTLIKEDTKPSIFSAAFSKLGIFKKQPIEDQEPRLETINVDLHLNNKIIFFLSTFDEIIKNLDFQSKSEEKRLHLEKNIYEVLDKFLHAMWMKTADLYNFHSLAQNIRKSNNVDEIENFLNAFLGTEQEKSKEVDVVDEVKPNSEKTSISTKLDTQSTQKTPDIILLPITAQMPGDSILSRPKAFLNGFLGNETSHLKQLEKNDAEKIVTEVTSPVPNTNIQSHPQNPLSGRGDLFFDFNFDGRNTMKLKAILEESELLPKYKIEFSINGRETENIWLFRVNGPDGYVNPYHLSELEFFLRTLELASSNSHFREIISVTKPLIDQIRSFLWGFNDQYRKDTVESFAQKIKLFQVTNPGFQINENDPCIPLKINPQYKFLDLSIYSKDSTQLVSSMIMQYKSFDTQNGKAFGIRMNLNDRLFCGITSKDILNAYSRHNEKNNQNPFSSFANKLRGGNLPFDKEVFFIYSSENSKKIEEFFNILELFSESKSCILLLQGIFKKFLSIYSQRFKSLEPTVLQESDLQLEIFLDHCKAFFENKKIENNFNLETESIAFFYPLEQALKKTIKSPQEIPSFKVEEHNPDNALSVTGKPKPNPEPSAQINNAKKTQNEFKIPYKKYLKSYKLFSLVGLIIDVILFGVYEILLQQQISKIAPECIFALACLNLIALVICSVGIPTYRALQKTSVSKEPTYEATDPYRIKINVLDDLQFRITKPALKLIAGLVILSVATIPITTFAITYLRIFHCPNILSKPLEESFLIVNSKVVLPEIFLSLMLIFSALLLIVSALLLKIGINQAESVDFKDQIEKAPPRLYSLKDTIAELFKRETYQSVKNS